MRDRCRNRWSSDRYVNADCWALFSASRHDGLASQLDEKADARTKDGHYAVEQPVCELRNYKQRANSQYVFLVCMSAAYSRKVRTTTRKWWQIKIPNRLALVGHPTASMCSYKWNIKEVHCCSTESLQYTSYTTSKLRLNRSGTRIRGGRRPWGRSLHPPENGCPKTIS